MKKSIVSAVAVSFLMGIVGLQADSVAKEEAAALASPKMTEGVPAAKAKVEETESKEKFETKMDSKNFEKEAKADVKKEVTKEEVKSIEKEAKDAAKDAVESTATDAAKKAAGEAAKAVLK